MALASTTSTGFSTYINDTNPFDSDGTNAVAFISDSALLLANDLLLTGVSLNITMPALDDVRNSL